MIKNPKYQNPLVSLIIVNWNGYEVFSDCLDSLQRLTYSNWELIVVDNGSSDGSEKLVENYNLKYKNYVLIKNSQNMGFAGGNNQGFERAKGKYILLLNNDTKLKAPDFLDVMIQKMEEDVNIGVMQPKIYLSDRNGLLDNAGSFMTSSGFLQHWGFMQKDGKEFTNERYILSAKGACLLARRNIIERIGLFDKDFGSYFEETDFCWRVWLLGYKVVFYPKTYIWHKLGATSKKMNQYFINYHSFKNRILSLIKNLGGIHLITILVPHLMIVTGLGFYYIAKLEPKKSWMIFSAIAWNIVNITHSLRKRASVQSSRRVSDDAIAKFIMEDVRLSDMLAHFKKVEANF